MNTGDRIKLRRKQLGISADTLAEKIGVSRSTMFRYESGDIEKVPLDYLGTLSKALSTTPHYLMGWTEDPCDHNIGHEQNTSLLPPLHLSDFEREIITKLRLLPVEQQKVFLAYLTTLLNTQAP